MPRLRMSFLGGLSLEQAGDTLPEVKSQKGLALLCYLAVSQKTLTRSFLAALFWPDMPDRQALMNLRQALRRLKALKSYLLITPETIAVDQQADYWLDVAEFVRKATDSDDVDHLQEAISLYNGDFLDGFMLAGTPLFDEWMLAQRAQMREVALTTLRRLITHFQHEQNYALAIDYARHLLSIEPGHEETHRDLMRLLALLGRRSAALAQYDVCRRMLADELGVEPAAETDGLAERIRLGHINRETDGRLQRHNLPPQSTPFVGREVELTHLQQLLAEPTVRLITILGPGGMGKTRLALTFAERQLVSHRGELHSHPYQHGIYFISLAHLETADLLLSAIAEAINYRFTIEDNQQEQLLRYLTGKAMLLVLDSFEHLVAGAGNRLVSEILRAAPQIKIIITSREKMNLQIEQLFPIGGMTYPPENGAIREEANLDLRHFSAIQLFVQRARRLEPGFELTTGNQGHVLRICQLLQGMPLGIVLAASWVATLPLSEISQAVERDIDFLATDMGDVPGRQRSLRAAFDYSWKLLSRREQEIYAQISTFRSGFTYVAAQAVTGAALRDLRALVDKSLLTISPEGRYDAHELLRQYAAEKLMQTPMFYDTTREAHCAFYCSFLHEREGALRTSHKAESLEEIRIEQDNVRAAWHWAVKLNRMQQVEQGLESFATFCRWHGRYQEGEEVLELAMKNVADSADDRALKLLVRVLIWRAIFSLELGRTEFAKQFSRQSLDLLNNPMLSSQESSLHKAAALYILGYATLRYDYQEAQRLWSQSLALYEAGGDRWGAAEVIGHQAMIAWEQGRYDEAKRLIAKNLVIQQALGNQTGIGDMYSTMGWIALTQGYLEQAEALAQRCMTFYREAGDQAVIAKGLRDVAAPKLYLGYFEETEELLQESILIFNELGGGGDLVFTHILLGAVKTQLGQYDEARDWERLALQLAGTFRDRAGEGRALLWLGRIALAEAEYAEAQVLLEESKDIFEEIGQKDQLSSALASLGYANHALENSAAACRDLVESLETATEIGSFLPLLFAMPLAALLSAYRGHKEQAIELYALASRYSFVGNSFWFRSVVGQPMMIVASALPTDTVAAAQVRGASRTMWNTVQDVLSDFSRI
jgi:predicted ATPase/DNA-binding SARP family transcriptional activator